MTDTRWYVLDVNPEPWAIGPVGYARRGGKMSAYVGQNKQLNTYQQAIKEAMDDDEPLFSGKVSITFFFWRNQADYTTPQARSHRKHEADATNLLKACEDALQDVLYENDKDNSHVQAYIVDQGPGVKGKIVICIEPYTAFDSAIIPNDIWGKIITLQTSDGANSLTPIDIYDDSPNTLF